jgi:hypothetical protein
MSLEMQKPAHITSLATSSILVAVDIRMWTATRQDRDTSEEVTTAKKADKNAGRFTQHLLADNPKHKKVLNYRQTVYNWMQRRTYPWSGSQNILPVSELPKFMSEYANHNLEFNKLVDEFIADYPQIVSDMAFKMGDMFRRENYPTADQARSKFSMDLYTAEVPQGDFRVAIAEDLAEDLHNNYTRQAGNLVNEILNKQAEQFTEVMQSLSNCCDVETVVNPDSTTKVKRRKLYDSTVARALELCDTFKGFNLTANQELETARAGLERLFRDVNLDALRESDSMRVAIKTEVDDILSKFKRF